MDPADRAGDPPGVKEEHTMRRSTTRFTRGASLLVLLALGAFATQAAARLAQIPTDFPDPLGR
jgi:hypothetical protein